MSRISNARKAPHNISSPTHHNKSDNQCKQNELLSQIRTNNKQLASKHTSSAAMLRSHDGSHTAQNNCPRELRLTFVTIGESDENCVVGRIAIQVILPRCHPLRGHKRKEICVKDS